MIDRFLRRGCTRSRFLPISTVDHSAGWRNTGDAEYAKPNDVPLQTKRRNILTLTAPFCLKAIEKCSLLCLFKCYDLFYQFLCDRPKTIFKIRTSHFTPFQFHGIYGPRRQRPVGGDFCGNWNPVEFSSVLIAVDNVIFPIMTHPSHNASLHFYQDSW